MKEKTDTAENDLPYLAQSLKAPRIAGSFARIAGQARTSQCSFEEYLVAWWSKGSLPVTLPGSGIGSGLLGLVR